MPRGRKRLPSSVINKPMRCNWCNKEFYRRRYIVRHIKKCTGSGTFETKKTDEKVEKRLEIQHHETPSTSLSGAPKERSSNYDKKCNACQRTWANVTKLRFHIRREHFNLQAKLPYCDKKKVNQVWFEKVLNCNSVVEIRKTAPNTLVIRKLDDNTSIKVAENNTDVVDLSLLYPTKRVGI